MEEKIRDDLRNWEGKRNRMEQLKYRSIVLLGVFGVSLSSIIVSYATAPSIVLALYRMAGAVILLLPVVLWKERREWKNLSAGNFLQCLLSGIFLACHFSAYFESIRYTSIASSTLLVDTEVFFIAFVTYFIWKEKISSKGLIGIGITFMGSVILALNDVQGGSNMLHGDLLALIGAFCVSIYTIIGRTQRKEISTTLYTFLVYGSATVTLCIFCFISKTPVTGYEPSNYVYGFLLTIFCTLLGHSVFSWGLKYVPAAFVSTAKLGEPVFASILAVVLFAQIPSMLVIIGGAIILCGIYLYLSAKNAEEEGK